MAGDWIKMRTSLVRDGRVRFLSRSLATNVTHVCGALYVMWSLADELAVETDDGDGFIQGYTATDIDAEVGIKGFAEALPDCWIRITDEGVYLPSYQAHNGSTGKKRATDQKRQKQRRQTVANPSRSEATKTRPEKRREEKSREENKNPPTPQRGKVVIPESLNTPQFVEAWDEFRSHRKHKRSTMTPEAERRALMKCESLGHDHAIASIHHTIEKGWTGLQESPREAIKPDAAAEQSRLVKIAMDAVERENGRHM